MNKAVLGIQIVVLIAEFFAVILLGFEIYGHMNPDSIMIEAVIIGICLVINFICVFYKLYTERK